MLKVADFRNAVDCLNPPVIRRLSRCMQFAELSTDAHRIQTHSRPGNKYILAYVVSFPNHTGRNACTTKSLFLRAPRRFTNAAIRLIQPGGHRSAPEPGWRSVCGEAALPQRGGGP